MFKTIKNNIKSQQPFIDTPERKKYQEQKVLYKELKSLSHDRNIDRSIRKEASKLKHKIRHDSGCCYATCAFIAANSLVGVAAGFTAGIGAAAFAVTIPCTALAKSLYNEERADNAYKHRDTINDIKARAQASLS